MNPNRPKCDANGLDARTFSGFVNRRFSALVSPETEGIPGSFLAVEIREAQATAAQTFASPSGHALTVSVRGGVNEGVVAILNDATLTPKFGASATLHFLGRTRRSLMFTDESCVALELVVRKAEAAHAQRMAEIDAGAAGVQRRLDSASLAVKAFKIDSVLATLGPPNPPKTAADTLRRDSLLVEKARVGERRKWLDSIQPPADQSYERGVAHDELGKAYEDARKLIDLRGDAFAWWSFGVAIDHVSFNLFDPAAAHEAQLSKRTHFTRAISATYSRIRRSPFSNDSRYLAIGIRAGWENNLTELTKVEITDRQQIAPPPAERTTEKKTTAYKGTFDNQIETILVTADYYDFVADRLAVHLFPAFSSRTGGSGEVALGAGILLSARNAAKKTSIANVELFFNAPDLANARRSEESPWKRGVLGLRLTFPINFAPGT